ncbi:hypothetical protein RJ640_024020 [Escallonia rubra]|uniref:RNase H type-1 domain-containing protein n=1 Tax=Escallonia rubra TaxID=112253 RepID=A0AA88RRP4_9ASTE|nr:hypothetical protein RJ640_024020 [Escallonia rubra]
MPEGPPDPHPRVTGSPNSRVHDNKAMGIGVVIRDSKGIFYAGLSIYVYGSDDDPAVAEAEAIVMAAIFGMNSGFNL